ncbi:hypothetical protein [Rhizobium sp. Leaf391]|uniref:hypothetical protein n=1 Tax=Rhizobium sp. Leaf391 TaxID=1736360 RepID=UPI000AECB323|nr:hypothetical protein [Rhizobium sp. Leaf391]
MKNAYYQAKIPAFCRAHSSFVLGELTQAHGFVLEHLQRQAWIDQIALLQEALARFSAGHILFEFVIPRMGKRADVILCLPSAVVVIEFKVGAREFLRADIDQAHDYALDLKNFHKGSHDLPILPILCATAAERAGAIDIRWSADDVAQPVLIGVDALAETLALIADTQTNAAVDFEAWMEAGYEPTPTIVEAVQALFQNHGVWNTSLAPMPALAI